jgi:hypothetical protein
MASMYDALGEYLKSLNMDSVELSIQKIEEIVGSLPVSARWDRTWWGNSKHPSRTQAAAWMSAGWKVDKVDFSTGTVRFIKIK